MSVTEANLEELRIANRGADIPKIVNDPCGCEGREVPLNSLQPHEKALITGLPDNLMLPFLGVRPGKQVYFVARQRFNGPLVVEVDGRYVAISCSIASRIKVVKGDSSPDPVYIDA